MLELRTVTDAEFAEWVRVEARAYGNRLNMDPEALRPHFDLTRSIAVFDGTNIVGGAHSHRQEISVPEASSVIAGVANIAVQPTHRRQGIMTQMMEHQLRDVYQRGEPLAGLFASESLIYGRFGYGVASLREEWVIERQHNSYVQPFKAAGQFHFLSPEDITRLLPPVADRSVTDRPGVFRKSMHLWQREAAAQELWEGGRGGLFYIAYEREGGLEGYAKYRTAGDTVVVHELIAEKSEAAAALWRFCFDTDLVSRAEAERRPVDDPLPWMLADPRRLRRSTRDGLWLRLVDVKKALPLRGYMGEDCLTLEVKDSFCPWNQRRYRLEAGAGKANCEATENNPDLTLTAAALASTYLGGVAFTTLHQAGLVDEHKHGTLQRADRLFAVSRQPWTPFGF